MGECWKKSAALNLKIDNRSTLVSAGPRGSELNAGEESGVPLMQMPYAVESTSGSNATESVAPAMGLSFPSSGDLICSGSKARVAVELSPGCGPIQV